MNKKSILLVDDEEIIRNSFGMELRQENYEVTLASSGEEAITHLREQPFDLMITDLAMQGIGGLQVLQEGKKKNESMGVIILTGYGDLTSAIEALRSGADDYILKPCELEELLLRIERCLEKLLAFQKVKVYENILPVCMYCKGIRDDMGMEPGKGVWLKMEEYIHQHSGTHISHGCCPACYKDHIND